MLNETLTLLASLHLCTIVSSEGGSPPPPPPPTPSTLPPLQNDQTT